MDWISIASRCGDARISPHAEFRRAGFAAGPCLLKDTLQLAAFARQQFLPGPCGDADQRGTAELHC